MPPNQRQIVEQAKFEDQGITIEDQGIKQVKDLKALKPQEELESIEGLFPKNMRTDKIKNKIYEIKKFEEKIKRKDLKYEAGKCKYDFQNYETINSFDESIYAGKISIREAEMIQTNLLENMVKLVNKSRPKAK